MEVAVLLTIPSILTIFLIALICLELDLHSLNLSNIANHLYEDYFLHISISVPNANQINHICQNRN